ncbi:MAG: 3-phosphoserine/phosphohydroxythreonine transaminase [Balneolaceae bacterium]|nr:3-phosphoserine/phosphohydroxythreonine transaminase [Balneolaceae bacterium]
MHRVHNTSVHNTSVHNTRVHNFSAGPSQLPLPVLEQVQEELLDIQGIGASIMEISHRGSVFGPIYDQVRERLRKALGLDDSWHVGFVTGGATMQFGHIPLNFLSDTGRAAYFHTGTWSKKAIADAKLFGHVDLPFDSSASDFDHVPEPDETFGLDPSTRYAHFTSNNTIVGTQYTSEPDTGDIPLVCDASSDFLSRPIDVDRYGMIYAGAQKNVGPAGVTIVCIRDSFLTSTKVADRAIPALMNYEPHLDKMPNTPPVFPIYMVNLVLEWLLEQGGVTAMQKHSVEKASLVYDEIDKDDFYRGTAQRRSRSLMNIPFRLANEDAETHFIEQAEAAGLHGLKGHRFVGGMRASIYNACPVESVKALVDFMAEYRRVHG